MAMMTGQKRAVREAPWLRAILQRASARGLKSLRGLDIADDQVERRRDDAICLARQAGPGPRM